MIGEIFTPVVIVGILAAGIRFATPYLLAGIGETFAQLSGVMNLGVEGIMLMGAFAAFYVTYLTGNPYVGILVALFVGLLMGLLMAVISVSLKAQQGISGIGLYMFGLGLSDLLFQYAFKDVATVQGLPPLHIPVLSQLPVLGPVLFSQNVLTYLAFALVLGAWFVIEKTTLGLKIQAVGQNPAAADSAGVSVNGMRYFTVGLGGMLAGLAGASLSVALLNVFQQNLTSGMGFIAVALVYFGAWRPARVMLGALLFSMVNAFQLWVQVLQIALPSEMAVMLPYVLTIVALIFAARRSLTRPAALGKPYTRGA